MNSEFDSTIYKTITFWLILFAVLTYADSTGPNTEDITQGAINYLNAQSFEENFHPDNTTLVNQTDTALTLVVDGQTYYTNYDISTGFFNRTVSFSNAQKSNN